VCFVLHQFRLNRNNNADVNLEVMIYLNLLNRKYMKRCVEFHEFGWGRYTKEVPGIVMYYNTRTCDAFFCLELNFAPKTGYLQHEEKREDNAFEFSKCTL
jgi:hypothetical protein